MIYRKQWSGKLWKLPSFWYASLVRMQILGFFFSLVGLFLVHIIAHCGVMVLTEECTHWTVIVKHVSGDEESNARKAQAFIVLEGKPCCVSHLQYNLQIYWNSYFPYTPLKIWIIWGFLPLSCISHEFLDIKPLSNIWFGISSVNL